MLTGTPTILTASVATSHDLAGVPDDPFKDGDFGYVSATKSTYQLDRASSATPDGVEVLATFSNNGRWILRSGSSNLTVLNRAGVSALDDRGLLSGAIAYTTSMPAYFRLSKSSTLTVDGANVLATLSGTGRWIRRVDPLYEYVSQANWFIDPIAGNNENSGAQASPIQSFAEWFLRTDGTYAAQLTTLNVVGDGTGLDPFPYGVRPVNGVSTNATFAIAGSYIERRTGTMTAAGTNETPAANLAPTVTDSSVLSWTADVGKFVYTTSGPLKCAVILKDLGGGVARVSSWTDPSNPLAGVGVVAPPDVGTTYRVVDMTSMLVSELSVLGSGNFLLQRCKTTNVSVRTERGFRAVYAECQIVSGLGNGGYAAGGMQLEACAISGPDFIIEAGNATLLNICGVLSYVGVNGGARLILLNCTFQGAGVSMGHGTANVLAPVGGYIGFITNNGFFDVPATAVQLDRGGVAYILPGGTLYGSGNGTGTSVLYGGLFVIRGGVTPTLTGGTELSVVGGATGILPLNQIKAGRSVALVNGTKVVAVPTTAQSTIRVTRNTPIGVLGAGGLVVPDATRTGAGFTVNSVDLNAGLVATDQSTFDWDMIEPAAPLTTWAQWNSAPFSRTVLTNDYSRIITA